MNVIYFTLLNQLKSLKHAIFYRSPKNRKEQKIKYVLTWQKYGKSGRCVTIMLQKITKYCTLKSRKTLACFNPFKIKLLCAVEKIFSLPIINNRILIIGTCFFW